MTLKELIKKTFFLEILKGMALTFKMMCSRAVTIQYPKERRKIYPGFRGRHALVRDHKTGKEKCIACMRCSNICPSQCIYISKKKRPEDGKLYLAQYDIEALRCIYCAYCVEVCPVCALVLTEEYEYSAYTREELYFTKEKLLQNWDEFAAKQKEDTYFNKFWRPDGLDHSKMPKGKREQGPVPTKPIVVQPESAEQKTESPPEKTEKKETE